MGVVVAGLSSCETPRGNNSTNTWTVRWRMSERPRTHSAKTHTDNFLNKYFHTVGSWFYLLYPAFKWLANVGSIPMTIRGRNDSLRWNRRAFLDFSLVIWIFWLLLEATPLSKVAINLWHCFRVRFIKFSHGDGRKCYWTLRYAIRRRKKQPLKRYAFAVLRPDGNIIFIVGYIWKAINFFDATGKSRIIPISSQSVYSQRIYCASKMC